MTIFSIETLNIFDFQLKSNEYYFITIFLTLLFWSVKPVKLLIKDGQNWNLSHQFFSFENLYNISKNIWYYNQYWSTIERDGII